MVENILNENSTYTMQNMEFEENYVNYILYIIIKWQNKRIIFF